MPRNLATAVSDRLDDEDATEFLDWAFDCLAPTGVVVLCQTHADNPDRAYLEHILEWPVHHRDEKELTALFERSVFGSGELDCEHHCDGTLLVAIAKKAR